MARWLKSAREVYIRVKTPVDFEEARRWLIEWSDTIRFHGANDGDTPAIRPASREKRIRTERRP